MIRESIEPGTKVWHGVYGYGRFVYWHTKTEPVIRFDDGSAFILHRKDLTEVEEI